MHNTQPWSFLVEGNAVTILGDARRRLRVLDPLGRQLVLSCGCALLTARVSLADDGVGVRVTRLPDPDVIAQLVVDPDVPVDARLAELGPVVEHRQTNRRAYSSPFPDEAMLLRLEAAARAEGSRLAVLGRASRVALGAATRNAENSLMIDPAYREEIYRWTVERDGHGGVASRAVPRLDAESVASLVRNFDMRYDAYLPPVHSGDECVVVVTTSTDEPIDWVRAGEALQRVWLEVTSAGFVASPVTQAMDVTHQRQVVNELVGGIAQVPLRIGSAPVTPSSTSRRPSDVVTETPTVAGRPPGQTDQSGEAARRS